MAGKKQNVAPENGAQVADAGTVIDTTAVDTVTGTVVDTTAAGAVTGTVVDTTEASVVAGPIDETTDGDGFNINATGSIILNGAIEVVDNALIGGSVITNADITATEESGTVVPEVEMEDTRRAVAFLGPYHRYSRGDIACFDAEYAKQLVARRIAVWPEDAKRALNPRKGDDDHETDIG